MNARLIDSESSETVTRYVYAVDPPFLGVFPWIVVSQYLLNPNDFMVMPAVTSSTRPYTEPITHSLEKVLTPLCPVDPKLHDADAVIRSLGYES